MTQLAYALSSEEHDARTLVATARRAEEAGFRSVWISDHYHPWIDRQGHSPFVWSVIGGIAATTELTVTTGVTCPILRIHPAILAQATATSANLLPGGRFRFGVGSGEALNEHILGDRWPPADLRLEMLAEAVDVIRKLWTGDTVTHRGEHYTVENARIYTTPDDAIPVLVSAFGPQAVALAATIGDGWVTTSADADMLARYRDEGGTGPALGSFKVCWGEDEAKSRSLAHELWPTSGIPGQLHQDLPTPAHFEQAAETVTEERANEGTPCGPDPEPYVEAFRRYADAGFDEVALTQIGPDQDGFFRFYESELRSRLGA
ncbi:MAG TPA: TIGR03557 family F420-dependent LLM class oxidoreductase [Acidimicrobiales bacterium]|jgi:G6PDH family F420-dependent oxidoreductase|nr:TIGR03557 family F420-dependent LLM class oxidoreductase [Acidimicrobiales bacterium]